MGGTTSRGKICNGVETEARIANLGGGSKARFPGFSRFFEGSRVELRRNWLSARHLPRSAQVLRSVSLAPAFSRSNEIF